MVIMASIVTAFVIRTLKGGVLLFDDGFFPFDPKIAFIQSTSSWNNPFFSGGSYYGNFYYAPLTFSIWILRLVGASYSISEAIYIDLNLFIGVIGTYLLTVFITREYVYKNHKNSFRFMFGSAIASFYYIFNYQQMTYYGGEFYQGFILVNFTPLLLYLILRFFSTPVKFGFWNKYLGLCSIVTFMMSGGLQGADAVGTDYLWFALLVLVTILFGRLLTNTAFTKDHFYKKSFFLLASIILPITWTFQALIYGAASSFSYITSTSYLGEKIIYLPSSGSVFPKILDIFTSGYYGQVGSFGEAGPNRMWYAPLEYLNLHPILYPFLFLPFVLSFLYIIFIKRTFVKTGNLLAILISSSIFYLLAASIINIGILARSGNLLLSGINFSLSITYSVYVFVLIITVTLAISLNLFVEQYFNSSKKYGGENPTETVENSPPKKRRTSFYAFIILITLLFSLFALPIMNDPLENWQFQNKPPISGVFEVNNDYINVGEYLTNNSMNYNVLILPITASPFATSLNNSSFEIVSPPFSSFFNGETLQQDPGPSNSSLAYPILKYIPNGSFNDFSNYLRLLAIKYIIINTAEYPTWVSIPKNNYADGGPPWNFSALFSYLNSSSGIIFAKEYGPYYIYKLQDTLPSLYLSSGMSSSHISGLNSTTIFFNYSKGQLLAGKESLIDSNNVVNYNGTIPHLNFQELSSTLYKAHVELNSSLYLILSQSYSNHWFARINGTVLSKHFEANDFANAWLLPKGNYTIEVYFKPQITQNILNEISLISISLFTSMLLVDVTYGSIRKRIL